MNKALFKIILQIISSSSRDPLRTLCLDYDEKKIVATNGRVQLVIDAPELDGAGQILVPQSALEAAYRLADKTTPITFTDRIVKVGPFKVPFTSATFIQRLPDGTEKAGVKYPPWKSVVPPDKTENDFGQFGFYNSKHVAMIEQLTPIFGEKLTFHLPAKHDGVLKVVYGSRAVLLVMPCKKPVANKFYGEEE